MILPEWSGREGPEEWREGRLEGASLSGWGKKRGSREEQELCQNGTSLSLSQTQGLGATTDDLDEVFLALRR